MTVTIMPLGGFGEVGRNCLALDIDGKIILIDLGIDLEKLLKLEIPDKPHIKPSIKKLIKYDAIPEINLIRKRKKDVVAIICSHAHLDHIGAIPYLYKKFNCQIHTTAFTNEIINSISSHKNLDLDIHVHSSNDKFNIAGINIDFIPVSHSTPDAVIIAIHTSAGIIMYANDFKFDATPVLGTSTDKNQLKTYKNKVRLLFLDSLYSYKYEKCPSEMQARNKLLKLDLNNKNAIFATTFASHLARLLSLTNLAEKYKRKIIFMGSSMKKYITAAKNTNLIDLTKKGTILANRREINNFFSKSLDLTKYFFIVTGHQGETNAVLTKLVNSNFPFTKNDLVIFSNNIIPAKICIQNRKLLEDKLKQKNVQIIKDIHSSGHLHAKDHQEFLKLINPEIVVPSHGDFQMTQNMLKIIQKRRFKTDFLKNRR